MILSSRHSMAQKNSEKGRYLKVFLCSMVGGQDIVSWYLLQITEEKCKILDKNIKVLNLYK